LSGGVMFADFGVVTTIEFYQKPVSDSNPNPQKAYDAPVKR
jgi:hypothetical protein